MTDRRTVTPSAPARWLASSLAALLVVGFSLPTEAIRIQGPTVVVPVIAHNPGLLGTEWRTDVWVDNPYGDTSAVTLTFYPEGGDPVSVQTSIAVYSALHFPDIVLNTFGMNDTKGMLVVSAPDTGVEVRARIYNTGSAEGEYGQAVVGLPTELLRRQGRVGGVSTTSGNRVSVGIANPTEQTFDAYVRVLDADTNTLLHNETVTLGPHQLIQLSDVATLWGLPASPNLIVVVNLNPNSESYHLRLRVGRPQRHRRRDLPFRELAERVTSHGCLVRRFRRLGA